MVSLIIALTPTGRGRYNIDRIPCSADVPSASIAMSIAHTPTGRGRYNIARVLCSADVPSASIASNIALTPTGRGRYKSGRIGQGRRGAQNRTGREVLRRPRGILKGGEEIRLGRVSGVSGLGPQREVREVETSGEGMKLRELFPAPSTVLVCGPLDKRCEQREADHDEGQKSPRSSHGWLQASGFLSTQGG